MIVGVLGKSGGEFAQIAGALKRRGYYILFGLRRAAAVPFIVKEEIGFVAATYVRNVHRAADASSEGIEPLRSFLGKVEHPCVKDVVLKILKQTPVECACSGLGREGNVAHLGELRIVVERGYLELSDAFS